MQIKAPQLTFIKRNQTKIHKKHPQVTYTYTICTYKNTTSNLYLHNMHK